MNKRKLKKQLQYDIADAVDLVILQQLKNNNTREAETDKKVNALLDVYDSTFSQIGKAKTAKGKDIKKHFRSLLETFDKQVETIVLGDKK